MKMCVSFQMMCKKVQKSNNNDKFYKNPTLCNALQKIGEDYQVVNLNTHEMFKNVYEAADTYNIKSCTLYSCIHEQHRCSGFYWDFYKNVKNVGIDARLSYLLECRETREKQRVENLREAGKLRESKRQVYNLNTRELFANSKTASEYYGLYHKQVSSAIYNKCRAGGYYWQYKDVVDNSSIEDELQKYENQTLLASENKKAYIDSIKRSVVNLFTGETYESAIEASKVQGFTWNSVSLAAKHGRPSNDTYWAYIDQLKGDVSLNNRKQYLEKLLRKNIKLSKEKIYVIDKTTNTVYYTFSQVMSAFNLYKDATNYNRLHKAIDTKTPFMNHMFERISYEDAYKHKINEMLEKVQ